MSLFKIEWHYQIVTNGHTFRIQRCYLTMFGREKCHFVSRLGTYDFPTREAAEKQIEQWERNELPWRSVDKRTIATNRY